MFIKLSDDQNAIVTLEITIGEIYSWNYYYEGDNYITNSKKLNKPKKHDLGVVSSLKGDINEWKIGLWNLTDTELEVTLKLEWTGGVNGATTWVNGQEKVKVPANSQKIIKGTSLFI